MTQLSISARGSAVLVLLGLLAGCSKEKASEERSASKTESASHGVIALDAAQVRSLGVRFEPAKAATDVPVADVPATIAPPPNARVAVAATIPGVVTRTMVVEGQSVRAGQVLAVVASREVLTMHAAMEQASARAAVSRSTAARLDRLAQEGVIAGARADEANAARREAEAVLGEQRRTLALVRANGSGGTYTLTAPISGKVTKASIQTGMPVDGASAPYVIDAIDRYELTAQLPARLISQIEPGMHVRYGDALGTITSVGSVIDPATRSATIRARLPATAGIVAGQAVSVTLLRPAPSGALAVPNAAVISVDGRQGVFVRTPGGAGFRPVETAGSAAGVTVVLKGLRPGEAVAQTGTSELKSILAAN